MVAGFSIAEVLFLLFAGALAPADLEPLPPGQILGDMPADCEFAAFADLRGGYDSINDILTNLSTRPWVVSNRDMAEGLSEVTAAVSGAPAQATSMLGFDPFSQLTSVAFCGRLGTGPSGDPMPSFVVVVRGDFDSTVAGTIASQAGFSAVTLSNGASAYGERENGVIIGLASPGPGVLFLGTEDLLAPRAAGTAGPGWETAAPESLMGRLGALAADGPRTMAGFQPSAGTRFLISGEAPVSIGQLVAGLDMIVFASSATSNRVEARATNPDAFDDQQWILAGVGEYAKAAPHAMRAFGGIVLGVLSPDDPDLEPELRVLVSNRDDLFSFLEEMGFLQEAEVTFNADPATLTTSLQIDNAGGLAGGGVLAGMVTWGLFTARSVAYEEPVAYPPSTPSAP